MGLSYFQDVIMFNFIQAQTLNLKGIIYLGKDTMCMQLALIPTLYPSQGLESLSVLLHLKTILSREVFHV